LVTENRLLRTQINGRICLSDDERTTLVEIGKKLGKQALKEMVSMVSPDTILAWYRKLVAQKYDGSQQRRALGRPMWCSFLQSAKTQLVKARCSAVSGWATC
jgi:hypothetical protein